MATTTTTDIVLYLPTPGSREPAAIALLNTNFVNISAHDHGAPGSGKPIRRVLSGLAADRGGAGTVGSIYYSTDTGEFSIDTGSVWTDFLVEGGQGTTTGWIMNDPVVRDELLFGATDGSADDAFIRRVGVNRLRSDASWGIGVDPSGWGSTLRALQFGAAGAVRSDTAYGATGILNNSYNDGTDSRAIVAGPSQVYNMGGESNIHIWYNAPSVAAGAVQSFVERMRLDANGNLGLGVVPSAWSGRVGFQFGQAGSVAADVSSTTTVISSNTYWDGANKAIVTGPAATLIQGQGAMTFYTAPSVAAGAVQAFASRFVVDSAGNMGLGTTPQAWGSGQRAIQVGVEGVIWGNNGPSGVAMGVNTFYDGAFKAISANASTLFTQTVAGTINFATAPSVAAGAVQTFTTRLAIALDGSAVFTPSNLTTIYLHNGASTNGRIATGVGNLELSGAAGNVHPSVDNTMTLGGPSVRWVAVYAVNGAIQTSLREAKEDFSDVSSDDALAAVKRTPIQRFRYKPTRSEDGHELMGTEQVGYVAEDADPLLTLEDGVSVNAQHTASVALAAIQALLVRVEALEGARGQNPRQPTP